MHKLFRLAWRNVWRNKRRSLITIAAIAFAVLIVTVTRSLQYGTYDTMESMAVRLYNGEIQVHRTGFQEEQTLTYSMNQDEQAWQEIIDKYREFTGVSRRVTGFGLISSDSASAGALIVGIEPEQEGTNTQFTHMVRKGEKLQTGDDHKVLVGQTLAQNLQVGIGDTIVVLTQGFQNQMGADTYIIKGLLSAGNSDVDRGIMVMPLHNSQDLFSLYDGVTQVIYATNDFRQAEQRARRLATEFNNDRLEILTWEEMMPELRQIIVMDNVSGAIYLVFLLIVVGFEIFNTTMMSVIERTREFGLLESMGMKPGQITSLVLLESTMKILSAIVAGLVISAIAIAYFIYNPIALSQTLQDAYASYGFTFDSLVFAARAQVFIEPLLSITIISFIALLFPIYKTRKLSPIEALRKA